MTWLLCQKVDKILLDLQDVSSLGFTLHIIVNGEGWRFPEHSRGFCSSKAFSHCLRWNGSDILWWWKVWVQRPYGGGTAIVVSQGWISCIEGESLMTIWPVWMFPQNHKLCKTCVQALPNSTGPVFRESMAAYQCLSILCHFEPYGDHVMHINMII